MQIFIKKNMVQNKQVYGQSPIRWARNQNSGAKFRDYDQKSEFGVRIHIFWPDIKNGVRHFKLPILDQTSGSTFLNMRSEIRIRYPNS